MIIKVIASNTMKKSEKKINLFFILHYIMNITNQTRMNIFLIKITSILFFIYKFYFKFKRAL